MAHSEDFVGVATETTIFVGVGSRAEFNKIALPFADRGELDGNHVLVKSVEQGALTVIFQHWIKHRRKACAEEV